MKDNRKNKTERTLSGLQQSLINHASKLSSAGFTFSNHLTDTELQALNIFLKDRTYKSVSEELNISTASVGRLLVGKRNSVLSKLLYHAGRISSSPTKADRYETVEDVVELILSHDKHILQDVLRGLSLSTLYSLQRKAEKLEKDHAVMSSPSNLEGMLTPLISILLLDTTELLGKSKRSFRKRVGDYAYKLILTDSLDVSIYDKHKTKVLSFTYTYTDDSLNSFHFYKNGAVGDYLTLSLKSSRQDIRALKSALKFYCKRNNLPSN